MKLRISGEVLNAAVGTSVALILNSFLLRNKNKKVVGFCGLCGYFF